MSVLNYKREVIAVIDKQHTSFANIPDTILEELQDEHMTPQEAAFFIINQNTTIRPIGKTPGPKQKMELATALGEKVRADTGNVITMHSVEVWKDVAIHKKKLFLSGSQIAIVFQLCKEPGALSAMTVRKNFELPKHPIAAKQMIERILSEITTQNVIREFVKRERPVLWIYEHQLKMGTRECVIVEWKDTVDETAKACTEAVKKETEGKMIFAMEIDDRLARVVPEAVRQHSVKD